MDNSEQEHHSFFGKTKSTSHPHDHTTYRDPLKHYKTCVMPFNHYMKVLRPPVQLSEVRLQHCSEVELRRALLYIPKAVNSSGISLVYKVLARDQ